jgi:large subunit ribosomal protein L35
MAGISLVQSMVRSCGMLARYARTSNHPTASLQCSLTSSWAIHSRTAQSVRSLLASVLSRPFSNLSSPRYGVLASHELTHFAPLRYRLPSALTACVALPLVPVRTVVKHSKLGKMKTVKAVAKRFRRTGSGKLKFWPPGNVHNLLSKSHGFKCRVRRPRYANKTQLKTLNKMLNGRYS